MILLRLEVGPLLVFVFNTEIILFSCICKSLSLLKKLNIFSSLQLCTETVKDSALVFVLELNNPFHNCLSPIFALIFGSFLVR